MGRMLNFTEAYDERDTNTIVQLYNMDRIELNDLQKYFNLCIGLNKLEDAKHIWYLSNENLNPNVTLKSVLKNSFIKCKLDTIQWLWDLCTSIDSPINLLWNMTDGNIDVSDKMRDDIFQASCRKECRKNSFEVAKWIKSIKPHRYDLTFYNIEFKEQIKKLLPTKEDDCLVCLDNTTCYQVNCCKNTFCLDCLTQMDSYCALCRQNILPHDDKI
jgi:hypothetical protein